MSSKSVFRSLQDIFPQVDLRILKAVAIEHYKDVNAAVEFIISEVLPSISVSAAESYTSPVRQEELHQRVNKSNVSVQDKGVEQVNTILLPVPKFVARVTARCDDQEGLGHFENLNASPSEVKSTEHDMDIISDHEKFPSDSKSSLGKTKVDDTPSSVDGEGNGTVDLIVNAQNSCGLGAQETVSAMPANDQNSSPVVKIPNLMEIGAVMEKDTNSSDLSSSALENLMDSTIIGAEPWKDVNAATTEHENMLLTTLAESSDLLSTENVMVPAETVSYLGASENAPSSLETHLSSIITTRSGHLSIEFLEGVISDSKSNKKALECALERSTEMCKEVEVLEEKAKRAKEEASTAGQNTLSKVEELKQTMKHAKEANDMLAGEVYGEKAILAAEARELQSRLINLSNENDKYLPFIEEIRQTFEARLIAAEKEIQAAEQEKFEKEEMAQKALLEQQVVMAKMVEDSKILEKEAEENSKFREFLMDQGRVVDILQGEIAVICEDVLSLKDKVDGRVLLSKFQSLTTSSLASSTSSSNSSFRKFTISLPCFPHLVGSAESHDMIDQEHPKMQQVDKNSGSGMEVDIAEKQKATSDDEWELFEAEEASLAA